MTDILFLDIDGVLNRRGTKERCNYNGYSYLGVDRVLAERLTDWLKENPHVQVVLSSTWRKHQEMWNHLRAAGIRWVDVTPVLNGSRGEEIALWCKNFRPDRFAILDDDSDMLEDQLPHFVQTDTDEGLQDSHIAQLTALLGGKEKKDDAAQSARADSAA